MAQNDKTKNSRFYDQRTIGYKNYGVKILLGLLKFYKWLFFSTFLGYKKLRDKSFKVLKICLAY